MADSKKISENFLSLLDSIQPKPGGVKTVSQLQKDKGYGSYKKDRTDGEEGYRNKRRVKSDELNSGENFDGEGNNNMGRRFRDRPRDINIGHKDNVRGRESRYNRVMLEEKHDGLQVGHGREEHNRVSQLRIKNSEQNNEYNDSAGNEQMQQRKPQKQNNYKVKIMGFKFLESLLHSEPSHLLTTLASPRSGFQELINDRPLRPDLLILIVNVLNKVNESQIHQLKMQILSETFKPEFIDEIKKYVGLICIEDNTRRLQSIEIFYRNVLFLFESVVDMFPSLMNEKLRSLLVALSLSMKNAKEEQQINVSDGLFDQLKCITDQVNSYIENKKMLDREQQQTNRNETFAPNNFRDLPLVPVKDDFMSEKTFLRQNIVKGSFKDVEQYLDIQFRLLREDFIGPLRTGIFEYIDSLNAPHAKRKYSNVRIYPKVQFENSYKSRDTFGFLINFDCDKKLPKNMNWDYSKRFMVGSLLLFTDDYFKTFYLATVVERDTQKLNKCLLCIAFLPGSETPEHIFEPGSFFVMAESEVYYEAYRHVLAALKRMNETNFPMKQYIVNVETACFPPAHLVNKSVYEVSGYEIHLLDEESWPTPDELKLNPSQHRALKSALTNDFVVIQGPPGTGKTFLALKITEILLKNNVSHDSPIVVICYTNHALDQFLEGILKYTNNLIRIGSQSQNEVLAAYNIDAIRKEKRTARTFNFSALFRDTISIKIELQEKLQRIENKVNELNTPKGILDLSVLKSVVTPQQYDELQNFLIEWLFFNDAPEFCTMADEPTQNFSSHDEVIGGESQGNSVDAFQNMSEFQEDFEEEMDDEENARRVADLKEDNFFEEDFIREENYISTIVYSVVIENINQRINELNYEIHTCTLPDNSGEKFFFERNLKDNIKELTWQITFMNRHFSKFSNLKFDPEKFEKLQKANSVWEINPNDRWEYYMTWIHLYSCQLKQTIQYLTTKYQEVLMRLNELKQLEDLSFVRGAAVVGLTTSGAAKRRVLLENLGTKIVIVEEAAEVLEAHIVTSLSKSVEHVILIGDHKQLKPKPSVFQLAKKYNMDVSLFERMLKNGLGCYVLDVQHRMRPEIASLIVPTIYPSLINHPSVDGRPKISGIDKFVFFLTHNCPEDQLPDSSSKQNKHEGDLLMSLCHYLLLQGYQPEEITILATYTGQVWYMRKEKRNRIREMPEWKNVRITPVDNYQGEENRIILLSLVRSNKENKIGFLATENRVCVALSRAKEGLYIVGNMDNLTASSSIWPRIKQRLEEINAISPRLIIRCEQHPNETTLVSTAKDFSAAPEGGCSLNCGFRLDCGHVCPRICHILDRDHGFYKCTERCERPPCDIEGHKCPLVCWKPCEPCIIPVQRDLMCGHSIKLACHIEPATAKCRVLVPAVISRCGHTVQKPCYMDEKDCPCSDPCTTRLPCGHACVLKCHVNRDPDHIEYKCMKDCTKPNVGCKRNHKCLKSCYQECGDCTVLVTTNLLCGHTEKIPCSTDESAFLCRKPCTKTLSCGHKCPLQCWLQCDAGECKQLVDKEGPCGHTFKKMNCNKSTETRKCVASCTRKLACGHPCTDKCCNDCAKVQCQVLVESLVDPACGHPRPKIHCHLNKPGLHSGDDKLLQACQEKCNTQLPCGHVCSGRCQECMQGRLHIPCNQKCNKQLICGHKCTANCGELCPPCSSTRCFNNCNHRKCNKKHPCSKMCDSCTRPCGWQCPHLKCTKQCGEECNRPMCPEACPTQLPCGHPCIGYCGEVCPTLCLVCDRNNPNIVPYTHRPDTKFVQLEDCDHVIETRQLEKVMDDATKDSIARLMTCPQCKVPIVKTMCCRAVFIRFRKQASQVSNIVQGELVRFRKLQSQHIKLFKSEPTNSIIMNQLLVECSEFLRGDWKAQLTRLLISCLLQPLATRCLEVKRSLSLSGKKEEEQRLRMRLDYLGLALRRRIRQIGFNDILQIELEVARMLRALETPVLIDLWYDAKSYTWGQDRTLMDSFQLQQPLKRLSSTLRTRDAAKKWNQCEKKHLYINENETVTFAQALSICSTCAEEEEEQRLKLEKEENQRLEKLVLEQRRNVTGGPIPVTNFIRGGRGRGRGGRGRGGRGRGRGRGYHQQ